MLLVLLAARTAYSSCNGPRWPRRGAERAAAGPRSCPPRCWSATCIIDPAAAKGEILGIPFVMGSILLSLRALERRSAEAAFGAGLLALLAVGLKQNMVAGLVFGGIMLLGSLRWPGASPVERVRRGWPQPRSRVRPSLSWQRSPGPSSPASISRTVWYAVFGFRCDAMHVISATTSQTNTPRALTLLRRARGLRDAAGDGWFLLNLPGLLRRAPILTLAALAAGPGPQPAWSWAAAPGRRTPSVPIPSSAVPDARPRHRGVPPAGGPLAARSRGWSRGRCAGRVATVATAVSASGYVTQTADGNRLRPPRCTRVSRSLPLQSPATRWSCTAAGPTSSTPRGCPLPTSYLWSLPMRTLDPDLTELKGLLEGPDAPTWFVATPR